MSETDAQEEAKAEEKEAAAAETEAPKEPQQPEKKFDRDNPPEVLDLQHKIFRAFDDCYFHISEDDGKVLFVIQMGDSAPVSLPVPAMLKEFGIDEDSYDGQLCSIVGESLFYVAALRPGDALPREVLTGEASWDVEDRHRQIAYNRLTMQLVTWMSGSEELITDPDKLLQIAEDPGTKEKVQNAFDEVAEKLGYGKERRDEVPDLVHKVAEELAYIEALRDRFRDVTMIQNKMFQLRRIYGGEKSVLETASQVVRLLDEAVNRFNDTFDQVDAQTGEIMAVLKNPDTQKRYIRDTRDDLYKRLYAWDEIFQDWRSLSVERSGRAAQLIRELYKFLAPRFMKVKEWVLVTKTGPGTQPAPQPGKKESEAAAKNVMTW